MGNSTKIDSSNCTSSSEQPKKRKVFSKQTLAMLTTAGTLLFSACSNNPSSWKDYEQGQKFKSEINEQKRALKSIEKKIEKLEELRIDNAIRHNEKVDEYYFIKSTNPNAVQRLANIEVSIGDLKQRVDELDKQIAEYKNKANKTETKLIKSSVNAAGHGISGEPEKIEVIVR